MAAMLLLSLTPFLGASAGISVWEHWRAAFCGTVGGRFTDQMSILSEPEFCGGHVSFAYSLLSPYRLKEGFRLPLLRKHEEFMTSGKRSRYCNVPDVCSRAHRHSPFCATQTSVAMEGGPADLISRVEALMIVLWVCCCCCCCVLLGGPLRWGAEGFCSHSLCLGAHLCCCCVVYIGERTCVCLSPCFLHDFNHTRTSSEPLHPVWNYGQPNLSRGSALFKTQCTLFMECDQCTCSLGTSAVVCKL